MTRSSIFGIRYVAMLEIRKKSVSYFCKNYNETDLVDGKQYFTVYPRRHSLETA